MSSCFRSRVDAWYYGVIVFSLVVVLGSFAPVVWQGSLPLLLLGVATLLFAVGYPIWLLFSTDYTIDTELLLIRCGPFRWRIRLDDIESVRPSRSRRSSPALSLQRLEIKYRPNRSILVSPEDPENFCARLGHPATSQR